MKRDKHAHLRALQEQWGKRCTSDSRSGRVPVVKGGQGRTDAEVEGVGVSYALLLVAVISVFAATGFLVLVFGGNR